MLKIASILLFMLTVFAAYGGRFTPDFFTLPAILCLVAPWLAVATVVVSILWFVGGKWLTGALGVLALIASWTPLANITPLNFSSNVADPDKSFTLLTYNIIHGEDQQQRGDQKGNRSFEYVLHSGADIVCLQEVKDWDDPNEIPNFQGALRDSLFAAYPYRAGSTSPQDTKVLSKYPIEKIEPATFIEGPFDPYCYSFYKVKIKGRTLNLVNIHFKSYMLTEEERRVVTEIRDVKSAKASMQELKTTIFGKMGDGFKRRKYDAENFRSALRKIEGPLVICGDFNDVPESYCYRLLRNEGLEDAYAKTGFGPIVTYNKHLFWFHIDQIFYRGPIRPIYVKKGKLRSSDHYPLNAQFEFTE